MRFSQNIQLGRTDRRYTDFEKMVADWPKERLELEVSMIQNKRSSLTRSQRDRILDLHNKLKAK
jgi:hypothetical protein